MGRSIFATSVQLAPERYLIGTYFCYIMYVSSPSVILYSSVVTVVASISSGFGVPFEVLTKQVGLYVY